MTMKKKRGRYCGQKKDGPSTAWESFCVLVVPGLEGGVFLCRGSGRLVSLPETRIVEGEGKGGVVGFFF